MQRWIIGIIMGQLLGTVGAAGACAPTEQVVGEVRDAPVATAPRVLSTPVRDDAVRIISNPPFPAGRTPDYMFHGWRLALVTDRATWEAFTQRAGWHTAEFEVDFEREVIVFAAYDSIGGLLTFGGWEVGPGGRAVFQYGPPADFGPAWKDAGSLVLALAVPRAGLRTVDFVGNGKHATTIALP